MSGYKDLRPTVLITGITGYLGSQVCLHFLNDGNFHVRGTVRSLNRREKIEPLIKAFGPLFSYLEIVEADLLDEASLIKAAAGCNYIVHTASPFYIDKPKDE